jgi:HK97 gp10 family phage protein
MATNKSVEAFRRLSVEMMARVLDDSIAELNAQATTLVSAMKSVVVSGPTGNLATSIRKEPGKRPTVVRVVAGGELTTRKVSGKPYDYARAVEFGTEHVTAQPFFFPTYRLMRKSMRNAMRAKIRKRIKQYSAE